MHFHSFCFAFAFTCCVVSSLQTCTYCTALYCTVLRCVLRTDYTLLYYRIWNSLPSTVETDKTTAHALITLLRTYCTAAQLPLLSSAGFTAIVPVAMRLLDRYETSSHCLGLYLLLSAANVTSPGLLATFQEWILPHIFAHLE